MRLMYDSTDPNAIPRNAQMVAGYIDGTLYRWDERDWARFPGATKVRIARRTSTNDGHVLDVEAGIPTVWPLTDARVRKGIVEWVWQRRASGVEPTIYCNQLNDWQPLRDLFRVANVREPQWWVARYNNRRDLPTGAVAKQFANPPLAGGHYDLSVVADFWPGVDRRPAPLPQPEEDMTKEEHDLLVAVAAKVDHLWENYRKGETGVQTPGVYSRYIAETVSTVRASGATLDSINQRLAQLLGEGVKLTADGVITISAHPESNP